MCDDFPDLPQSYKQDVKKFVDTLIQDEKEDEKTFKDRHLSYAEKMVRQRFGLRPSAQNPRYKTHHPQVPLWLFMLLGTWALVATVLLGLVVGNTLPEDIQLPANLEQMGDQKP